MTQEEKTKRYDEVVNKLRCLLAQGVDPLITRADVQDFFPDFRESEDERIIKAQLDYWRSVGGKEWHGVPVQETIAWLEKQVDKPVDNLEPKFKVGDWIVFYEHHNSVYQVERIDNYRYYLRHYLGGSLSVHFDNEFIRAWTIQDAKDGDVLVTNSNIIFMFKYLDEGGTIAFRVSYTKNSGVYFPKLKERLCDQDVYPATQEQRELLFYKMKDAGYEFDFEKKELKKIKQKTVNKIEPKFHEGDWVVNKLGDSWHIDSFDKKNYQVSDGKGNYNYFPISKQDEMHLWTIADAKPGDVLAFKDDSYILLVKEVHNTIYGMRVSCYCHVLIGKFETVEYQIRVDGLYPATKEQRDLLFKKMKEAGWEWDAEKKELRKIEKQIEKPQVDGFDAELNALLKKYEHLSKEELAECLSFYLGVVQGEQKPEWTEEDEENFRDIMGAIHSVAYQTTEDEEARIEWLKSIKKRIEEQQ
jgi:signal peptidase I